MEGLKIMTNKRKAELFDRAMNYIYSTLAYDNEIEYEEVLEEIGFTEKEIEEVLKSIFDIED